MTDTERPSTPVRQVYRGLGWTYEQIGGKTDNTMQEAQTACIIAQRRQRRNADVARQSPPHCDKN